MKVVKPLWIPLKREYFDAFKAGTKTIEYRLHGRQWTAQHCREGREALLGCGYSGPRLHAVVTGFDVRTMDTATYGPGRQIARIHLRVLGDAASPRRGNRAATSPSRKR